MLLFVYVLLMICILLGMTHISIFGAFRRNRMKKMNSSGVKLSTLNKFQYNTQIDELPMLSK